MRAGANARASAVPRCVYRAATCVGWPARRGFHVLDVYLWPKKYFIIIIQRYGVPVGPPPSFSHSLFLLLSPPPRPLPFSREGTGANERARAVYLHKGGPVSVLSLSPASRFFVFLALVVSRRRGTIAQRDYQKIIRISIEGPRLSDPYRIRLAFYNEYDDGHATVQPVARCRLQRETEPATSRLTLTRHKAPRTSPLPLLLSHHV